MLRALLRAHKVSQKAAKAGFDWQDTEEVLNKLDEETTEFKEAIRKRTLKALKKSSATCSSL